MNMHVPTPSQAKFAEERRARLARMSGVKPAATPAPAAVPADLPDTAITAASRTMAPMPCGLPQWYFVVHHADLEPVDGEPAEPRIEFIKHVVAAYFRLTMPELVSERRTHNIVRPRQVGFYLCKILTKKSLPEIGRRFGGKDHTTVLHAVRKVPRLIREDSDFANDVATLIHAITGRYQ